MISVSKIRQLIEKEDEGPTLDYKEDLNLQTDGDKAQFVKDVLSLANSGGAAHIIIGVEDGTRKLLGIKMHHQVEQLNQILKDKSDPPMRMEYIERKVMGHTVGVVEIAGENPPYIVSVPDRYGGSLSSDTKKQFHIERGTVFVRNYNMNEGARRADLDKMYKFPYVTLQADLQLSHEISLKALEDSIEADITFFLENLGEVISTDAYMLLQFRNVREIVLVKGFWTDQSHLNNNTPTVRFISSVPICKPVRTHCDGIVVKVDSTVRQIEASTVIGSTNMRTKSGSYIISLKE